jgi:hypothetical protein
LCRAIRNASVGVTAQILRGAVHDEIDAELDRSLIDRRRERRVDERYQPAITRQPGQRLAIRHPYQRVGDRLP